jgi:hypothetical protein
VFSESDDDTIGTHFLAATGTLPTITSSDVLTVRLGNKSVATALQYTVQYIKLERGSVATPCFPLSPAQELLKCQRYYQKITFARLRIAFFTSAYLDFILPLTVQMRATPSFTTVANMTVYNMSAAAQSGFTYSIINGDDNQGFLYIRATKTSHGLTDGYLLIGAATGLDSEM